MEPTNPIQCIGESHKLAAHHPELADDLTELATDWHRSLSPGITSDPKTKPKKNTQ